MEPPPAQPPADFRGLGESSGGAGLASRDPDLPFFSRVANASQGEGRGSGQLLAGPEGEPSELLSWGISVLESLAMELEAFPEHPNKLQAPSVPSNTPVLCSNPIDNVSRSRDHADGASSDVRSEPLPELTNKLPTTSAPSNASILWEKPHRELPSRRTDGASSRLLKFKSLEVLCSIQQSCSRTFPALRAEA